LDFTHLPRCYNSLQRCNVLRSAGAGDDDENAQRRFNAFAASLASRVACDRRAPFLNCTHERHARQAGH